jgi:hypothetical protein
MVPKTPGGEFNIAGVIGTPANGGEIGGGCGTSAQRLAHQFWQLCKCGFVVATPGEVCGGEHFVHRGDGGKVPNRQVLLGSALAFS